MEQDIEIIKSIIYSQNGKQMDYIDIDNITPNEECKTFITALEHLIKAYKELEEKVMQKDLEIIGVEEYTKASMAEIIEHYYTANEDCIPESKIKEKIEELDEDLEIMKVDAMYGRYKEYGSKLSFEKQFSYKYGMHDVLQELLEKRK